MHTPSGKSTMTAAMPVAPGGLGRLTLPEQARSLGRAIWKHRWLYCLMALPILYFVIFKYWPLWNAQIAFKDFKPTLGVFASPWVGFEHFATFINSFYFERLLSNTLIFSFAKLVLGLPLAVIFAIALYETRFPKFRSLVQNMAYLPHFLSWVIVFGILLSMLSPGDGLINAVIKAMGGTAIPFLTSPAWFRVVVIVSELWKETGWSTIIYLAALLAIDPTLYEAAAVDGASRLQRIWNISLPGILEVIVVITLLRIGHILDAGFYQIFVLYSLPVYNVGDIIDTWVYRQGILEFQFGLATAVGLFKGVFGLLLLYTCNRIARRVSGSSLY